METLLELLGGPVFRFALVVALLGTLLQFGQNALVLARSAGGIQAGLSAALAGIGRWLSPAHRVRRIGWIREVLTWYRAHHPTWFGWLEMV